MAQAVLELRKDPEDYHWVVYCPHTGEQRHITGKKSALLSMILANVNYEVREDFHPFDAFTEESLKRGQPVN